MARRTLSPRSIGMTVNTFTSITPHGSGIKSEYCDKYAVSALIKVVYTFYMFLK